MKAKLNSMLLLLIIILISSCTSITTEKLDTSIKEQLQQDINNSTSNLLYQRDAIPNEEAAIKIAEAVLISIYGEEFIFKQRPFKCKLLQDSVWYVKGDNHVVWTEKS